MPDVQEVFRLGTQTVRPDPEALDRLLVNQRRSIRWRRMRVYALVGALATAALIVALGTVWSDWVRSIDIGTNPNDAPRVLEYQDYGRSVVAQGEDLGYRWTLSDRRPDTDDGACLLIGGENVCHHIDRETPFVVGCLGREAATCSRRPDSRWTAHGSRSRGPGRSRDVGCRSGHPKTRCARGSCSSQAQGTALSGSAYPSSSWSRGLHAGADRSVWCTSSLQERRRSTSHLERAGREV
jgi:hypothetical protein